MSIMRFGIRKPNETTIPIWKDSSAGKDNGHEWILRLYFSENLITSFLLPAVLDTTSSLLITESSLLKYKHSIKVILYYVRCQRSIQYIEKLFSIVLKGEEVKDA